MLSAAPILCWDTKQINVLSLSEGQIKQKKDHDHEFICYKTPEQKNRQNIRFPEPAYEKSQQEHMM